MRRSLLQLAGIAALGSVALAATAQQYGSPASPTPQRTQPTAPVDQKTQADNEYRAALARCNASTERMRSDCMRKAEDDYNHSFMHGAAAAGGARGSSSDITNAKR